MVPMTLGYVSSELYGIWLTLSSIVLWFNFFDVGFTLGLRNKLAESLALGETTRGRHLVSTTYGVMVSIFIPLSVIICLFIPIVDWCNLLNVSSQYEYEIEQALYVLGACFCLQMILNVLTAVIAAYQKIALSSLFPVIGQIVSIIIIYILTKNKIVSLTYLALTLSFTPIVVIFIASIYLYCTSFKEVIPSYKFVSTKYIKDIFVLGVKFFIIQIQVVVMYQTTNILISNLSGPNDVTAYNIAYKYLNIPMMIYNIILSPLWPAFTDAYTKNDYKWMKKTYNKMYIIWIVSTICIFVMILLSPYAYYLWIGEKASIPFIMTIAVAIYTAIHSLDSLQVTLINGIGCVKLQTYVTLIGLIGHIPLSLLLGKYIGCYGVIVSMIIIVSIYLAFFSTQINRILNHSASGIWCE